MEQAYFSEIRSKIIPCLEEAVNTIQVAMAWFTSSELFNALLDCLNRNVKVDLILLDDAINYMDYAPDFNQFIKAGGNLHIADYTIGFMHHKFCIVDSRIVITGSYNWTYYAETRNVENIIITDNNLIVDEYKTEFSRLKNSLSSCVNCKRLSWEEIEAREDVNFKEINYEIESICKVQQLPVKRVYETKTEVIKTEIKLTPFSKYPIGISTLDEHDKVIFCPFIDVSQKLPYRSNEIELYLDSKHLKIWPCHFIYGTPTDKSEWTIIQEVDLMQVASGTNNENLPVNFSMELDDNGSLRIDVSCAESGEKMIISILRSDLVKYE